LEPIFEVDFQPGSFGYRPKKSAHEAVERVAQAIVQHKTRVIDLDLRSYFDNVRHDWLSAKVAARFDNDDVMHLLKIMLKANGRYGVPQGGIARHVSLRCSYGPARVARDVPASLRAQSDRRALRFIARLSCRIDSACSRMELGTAKAGIMTVG